ncbi:glutamic-type intramembrane protease PrsW [Bacillus sp. 2205SS5-2]|uniref:glutamic-type intramembrane protease PrsW n=1 Tax=Bacillus sp. 2205SS5-2 TaxID=3109031 RepID=UPI00300778AD
MLVILSAGIAPGLAFLSYLYLKDQYEQEPFRYVLKTFVYGMLITFPILFIQSVFEIEGITFPLWGQAFLTAGLLEEFFKWFVLFFIVIQSINFDDPYDGIVFGASVSLGFATAENILYLLAHGVSFAFGRALLPVSSHALFGVIMGYYLGKSKFSLSQNVKWVLFSLVIPIILHGTYDYILIRNVPYWPYFMIPFMMFLWWLGLKKVKTVHLLAKGQEPYLIKKSSSF